MTKIGNLFLSSPGASENSSSALACKLTHPFSKSFEWACPDSRWHVAIDAGGGHVSARNADKMAFEDVKHHGMAAIMRALDLAAIQENLVSSVKELGDYSICRFYENEAPVVRLTSVARQAISIQLHIEQRDADGNLIPQPIPPVPVWNRAFRYYRLSQLATDIYEAYRNLYLAFEALAEHIFPRMPKEREGDWIRRAFEGAHDKYSLAGLVPENCRNPGDYLFGTLYKHVRCNLFHSQSADSILPYYQVDATAVQHAYEALLRVWRHISAHALGTSSGGGVVTHQGFRHMMSNALGANVKGIVTQVELPTRNEGAASIPIAVQALDECIYIGEVSAGMVAVTASQRSPASLPKIRCAGIMTETSAQLFCEIPDGLEVGDVAYFQMHLGFRLVQGGMPKTEF
ncbi:hypothetical protein [Cupriavidus basilensis]|uniref:hypothetical protein n=1 Tax=Cupriavidus basilensis TaxID=68895 RepID=UPI0012E01552|nr:hypothetical protein [Cupriavidus basilensis]